MRLSFSGFLKETAPRYLKGYGPGVKGAGNHVTYTSLQNKDNQITIDVPDNEWHYTIKGITKKIGKANDGSLQKFLGEDVKPLKTGVADILPGQANMFAMKDDVDPTLSGQAHDDNREEEYDPSHKKHSEHTLLVQKGYQYSGSYNNIHTGKRIHTYHHPTLEPKEIQKEDFMSTQIPISHGKVNSEDASNGYTFPQDQVSDVDDKERKRHDTLSPADGGSSDQGFGGRTESLIGIIDAPVSEMVDFDHGLSDYSPYSGSTEPNKLREKQKPLGTPAFNDYIGGAGNVGVAGNLPQEG